VRKAVIFKPLVALIGGSEVKSLAIIECLIVAPLVAFLMHYVLGLTDLPFAWRSGITAFVGIILVGGYARFATS